MPHKGLGQLERITVGERLLIDRRRRGETQGEAAARHGVSPFIYGQMERDKIDGPRVKVRRLEAHERCLLYRRRSDKTQAQVAKDLKCCRWWLNQMERGLVPCDTLVWYWEQ